MTSAKRQHHPNLSPHTIGLVENVQCLLIFYGHIACHCSQLLYHSSTHTLLSMVGKCVGYFVPHNCSQPSLAFGNGQNTCIDYNFSTGHTPSVDGFIVHQCVFP